MLSWRALGLALGVVLLASPLAGNAQNSFKTVATISATLGNAVGRVCTGASVDGTILGAIGCPSTAPQIVGGGISASSIVTATYFEGDGSRLTGIVGSEGTSVADRISSSNSYAMVLTQPSGFISLTTGNVGGTSYFDSTGRWVGPGVSITTMNGISSTNGYFVNRVSSGNGSGSLPSYAFANEDNTGLYLAGSGNVGFVSLGAHRGGFSNSVGTSSVPGLYLNNPSYNIFMMDGTSSKSLGLIYGEVGNQFAIGRYGDNLGSWEGNPFHIDMDAADSTLVVSQSSNIGLGVYDPQTKLDVAGSISASGGIQIGTYATCSAGVPGTLRYSGGNVEYCNGTGWTTLSSGTAPGGGAAVGDRITSGTLAMIANSQTSVVSLSTAGTTWGHFGSLLSYLPRLGSEYVSATSVNATNVSATLVQFRQHSFTCTPELYGSMHYDSNGDLLLCSPD